MGLLPGKYLKRERLIGEVSLPGGQRQRLVTPSIKPPPTTGAVTTLLDRLERAGYEPRELLTHTNHAYDRGGWEQHHYNVTVHDRIAEAFAERYQPGQVIVITGQLDLQLQDTLIGPLPYISIVARRIVTVDGPLNSAASAAAPNSAVQLQILAGSEVYVRAVAISSALVGV